MKKVILITALISVLASGFAFAKSSKKVSKSKAETKRASDYYTVSVQEMSDVIKAFQFLNSWENGEFEYSDDQLDEIYKTNVGDSSFLSLYIENFFRYTKNKKVQEQISKCIQRNNRQNEPFSQALLKKYAALEEKYKDGEKELVKYSYNGGKEFDENINHFTLNEVCPFNDEFGLMLFVNDWNVMNFKAKNEVNPDNKDVWLVAGGNTNSITVRLCEFNGVENKKQIPEVIKLSSYEEKYKGNWEFKELEKTGVLENCGADSYFVGFGTGYDKNIPEIAAGDVIAVMYNKELKKVYVYNIYENFSKININYETRDRIYDFLKFWVQLCFCKNN